MELAVAPKLTVPDVFPIANAVDVLAESIKGDTTLDADIAPVEVIDATLFENTMPVQLFPPKVSVVAVLVSIVSVLIPVLAINAGLHVILPVLIDKSVVAAVFRKS